MSKKILAMFLAVLMVVSILPASVLATQNDCPIEKGKHNLDNCASYTVKKVVDATCAAAGYTLYECDACGDTFMGNQTAQLAHEKSSVKEAAKAPTFTEAGNVTQYHCDLCNKDWWEKEPHTLAPLDITKADELFDCDEGDKCAFEWENKGKACATGGMVATCVKCGFQIVSKANHTVNYNNVTIVKAPTATANGEATAPCTVCGEKETIVIYPNHDHRVQNGNADDAYTLVNVDADDNCVTGGTIAHLKCVICGDLFLIENGKLVEKTKAELKGEPVESGKHTVGVIDTTKSKAVTCSVDGKLVYTCSVCGKKVEEVIPAGHDWEEEVVIEMTCGQNGITVRTCKREGCGLVDTVTETATKHTTLAEYQAAFAAIGKEIDVEDLEELEYNAACYEVVDGEITGFLKPVADSAVCGAENGGEYSWNCLNCGKVQKAASPKLSHNLVSYTVPATCATYSYTFKYCTNANCPLTASATVKDNDNNVYSAAVKTQVEVIKAVYDEEDENVLLGYAKVMEDVVIAAPKVSGKITGFGNVYDATCHNYDEVTKEEPTCTLNGNYYKKCADCGNVEKSTPAATGHSFIVNPEYSVESKRPVTKAPTCSAEGTITYFCKDCDQTKVTKIAKVTELQYTDLAKAEAEHRYVPENETESVMGLVYVTEQTGTCTKHGYVKYTCTGCEHTIIVSDEKTGAGHKDSMTFTSEEAETISVPASINGGYIIIVNAVMADGTAATGKLPVAITVNGVTIENFGEEVQTLNPAAFNIVLSALAFTNKDVEDVEEEDIYEIASYTFTVNFYTKQYPTCTADGKVVAHSCINEWCENTVANEFGEKKLNKLGHNYVTVKEAVTGVCGELETRAEIACSRCGDYKSEKINGVTYDDYYDGGYVYADESINGWDIDEAICKNQAPLYDLYYCAACDTYHIRNFKAVVPHTWNNGTVTTPATCGSTGVKTYTCTVEGCGATKTEPIAATKHKNSEGRFFTDHCNDTETNRHCVVCCEHKNTANHDCTKKTNGEYTCDCMIGKNHSATVSATEANWNPPTCTAAGFYMVICEYCDEAQVIVPEYIHDSESVKNAPTGHEAPAYSTSGMTEAEKILYAEKYTNVNGKAYLNYVAPTVLADGVEKFECATCGGVIERKLDRLENLHFSMVATNADVPGCDKFASFSLVALTIKATGVDATLAGFNMTVKFNGSAYFVGSDWAENTPFIGSVTPAQKVDNEINIMGRVIGSSEIAVEDEVLVTLYFRVLGDAEFSFKGGVYAVNAVEEIASSVQGTEIEVIDLGDVNGDGKSFGNNVLDDLQAAINIFMGVEGAESYNVAADINRNGEIDLQDLQLMCNLASLIATIDVDAEEPSVEDMETLVEIYVDLLLLNAYEGELELLGICTECNGAIAHDKDCSKYVKA